MVFEFMLTLYMQYMCLYVSNITSCEIQIPECCSVLITLYVDTVCH